MEYKIYNLRYRTESIQLSNSDRKNLDDFLGEEKEGKDENIRQAALWLREQITSRTTDEEQRFRLNAFYKAIKVLKEYPLLKIKYIVKNNELLIPSMKEIINDMGEYRIEPDEEKIYKLSVDPKSNKWISNNTAGVKGFKGSNDKKYNFSWYTALAAILEKAGVIPSRKEMIK